MEEPGELNFTIRPGAALDWSLQLLDDNKAPVDITGYLFSLKAAAAPGQPPFLEASTTDGRITIEDPAGGRLRVLVPGATTSALTPWRTPASWDLLVTPPGAEPFFLLAGKAMFVEMVN